MLELSQLEQLLTFAQYGTLSKAAEMLHISQPSLTRSMQAMENELQIKLFNRQKNKLTLNDNGKLAVEYAQKVINQMEELMLQVRAFDRANRTIQIGSCAPAPLWSLLPRLSQLCTNMAVTSEIQMNDDILVNRLKKHEYQLIIMSYAIEEEDCICKHHIDEQLYLSVPFNHPLAKKKVFDSLMLMAQI